MRKRRPYRAVQVKKVNLEKLKKAVKGERVVFAVDIGKELVVAVLMKGREVVIVTLKWKQPMQTREIVELLKSLPSSKVEVAMEPSGTYGDALRAALLSAGIEVYRVSGKRVHDMAEIFDGVPSHHDAKSAAIIGKLHQEGRSELWPLRSEESRDLRAAVKLMDYYEGQFQRGKGQLEALLARHWPELDALLELGSASELALLARYGSASEVAADAKGARELMRRASRWKLSEEKIEAVLQAARESVGVTPTALERAYLSELCKELSRLRSEAKRARKQVKALGQNEPQVQALSEAIGASGGAVVHVELGEASGYSSAAEYEKSSGLILRGKSSGKSRGVMSISKRGSSVVRRYLFLASLRLIKDCPVVRRWFEKKRERDGGKGKGGKALVAIMRKLIRALWHVAARGARFDSRKLFNAKRLGFEPEAIGG